MNNKFIIAIRTIIIVLIMMIIYFVLTLPLFNKLRKNITPIMRKHTPMELKSVPLPRTDAPRIAKYYAETTECHADRAELDTPFITESLRR